MTQPARIYAVPDKFSGDDPAFWLSHAMRYIKGQSPLITDADLIAAMVTYFTGSARNWARTRINEDGNYAGTLAAFKASVIAEFTKHNDTSYAELEIAELKQTGSVRDYTNKFHEIVARIPTMTADDRRRWYQNGLSSKIRKIIMSGNHTTYDEVRTVALAQDVGGATITTRAMPSMSAPNPMAMDVDAMQAPRLNRLSPADRDSARAAGLCFKCRQPGHISRYCPSGRQQQHGQRRGYHVHNMEWPAYLPMPYYPPYYAPYMGYPPGFGLPGPQAPEQQQQQQQQSSVFQPRQ